ncbi:S41 family peptidase [Rapidithrix thailandica]|uniref:S41 family peptidase n=1 Tax=Rapidithrix thailandica TaxID=413964 RepID=A0AAW9S824_9BACT
MQADLEKFKMALINIHPGTYTHQKPEEFERFVDKLLSEVSKPMAATKFYTIVLKLIAGIHDGHTQAYAFGELGKLIYHQKRLPFQVSIHSERIFIIKNLSTKELPEGSEILSIDNKLSNEILIEMRQHYTSDGKSFNGMYHWLGGPYRPFNRLYPEIFGEQPTYSLVYRDYKTKDIVTMKIDAIPKASYEKRDAVKYPPEKINEKAFNFTTHEKEGYAYMQINRFVKEGFNEPENIYPDFYKQCFEKIASQNIQNLIIDLRDNGGGKASNAAYLMQYFIQKPFIPAKEITTLGDDSYFLELTGDTLSLDEAFDLVSTNQKTFKVTKTEVLRDLMTYTPITEHAYSGKLIVLINGGTTSAGAIAAGLLKEYTNAVLVGEETFGYAGISNGIRHISIRGDSTEVAIHLPLLHTEYNINPEVKRRSVVPDFQLSNSMQNILSNKDYILEYTIEELLRQ